MEGHTPTSPEPRPVPSQFSLSSPMGPALALSCLSIPCGEGQILAVLSTTVEFRLGGHHKSSSILAPASTEYSISIVFSSQLSALFRRSPPSLLKTSRLVPWPFTSACPQGSQFHPLIVLTSPLSVGSIQLSLPSPCQLLGCRWGRGFGNCPNDMLHMISGLSRVFATASHLLYVPQLSFLDSAALPSSCLSSVEPSEPTTLTHTLRVARPAGEPMPRAVRCMCVHEVMNSLQEPRRVRARWLSWGK